MTKDAWQVVPKRTRGGEHVRMSANGMLFLSSALRTALGNPEHVQIEAAAGKLRITGTDGEGRVLSPRTGAVSASSAIRMAGVTPSDASVLTHTVVDGALIVEL